MGRSSASFSRPGFRYRPQPTVLVICEDKKSGRDYLEEAAVHFRVRVEVDVIHCGDTDPKGIVEEAIASQGKFDRVFCVVDRDEHANFDEALEISRGHGKICVVPSYPCFEFWLLIHFGYTRKPYARAGNHSPADQVITDLRKIDVMKKYAKEDSKGLFNLLLGEPFEKARQVAPRILTAAERDGTMNPSTYLHELIDFLEELSKPRPI